MGCLLKMKDLQDEVSRQIENDRIEEEMYEEMYSEGPSDDGSGPYDTSLGCSHCGFWQCPGCG